MGYLFCKNYGNYNHLHRIAVHTKYQGMGYGSMLMRYAISYFSKFKIDSISLYVGTNNNPAIKLYKKYNFTKIMESWHFLIDNPRLEFQKQIPSYFNVRELEETEILSLKHTFPE